ncbi:pyrroline-5-carboxylate reductase [Catenovulum agarivorans DS-2]|uniref:Pyrroline-5-carboxylate reductase n=1 Tax=Catenovulum agarivorans DS-2 TaxID=1328313 RepID=W7QJZ7_9ALTE|nr:pyrroline-5-carboxylate reductase [Catenovulum agarivorans]EWH12221.1 pyrroline-5-carboxylate reductase [Catenovulum agarivorans DS-2]
MTTSNRTVAFIGAGNMSASIIAGLVNSGYEANKIIAANPSTGKLDALKQKYAIQTTQDNNSAIAQADVVVLAVKPQIMADMLSAVTLDPAQLTNKLFISIAAGIPVARFQQLLGPEAAIVRTMPNTPSLLGLGLTGVYAADSVSQTDKDFTDTLMSAVGKTVWVDDEAGINKITALAGSAPAYFFRFMEALVQQAQALGFSDTEAKLIVEQVANGSAQMVQQNSDKTITELRQQVTSKGGTTAAAIASLEHNDLDSVIQQAVEACMKRAEEMAKQL